MRATRLNHVSVSASDLEDSARFYEEAFGMERIPTPRFDRPVQWLRVADLQLHLFVEADAAPARHHIGLTIDDLDEAYAFAKRRAAEDDAFGWRLVELPSGQIQLYLRDPAGNLIELDWEGRGLDRARYPELERLADRVPQAQGAERAVLFLHGPTA